jgi:macrolide-specific efflux system membrane fusion protein
MKRKVLWSSIVIFCLFSILVVWILRVNLASSTAPIPVSLENDSIVAPAIIDSPNDVVRIPTLQSGIIQKLFVQLGDSVKKGQILFSLEDTLAKNNLAIQKINVDRAQNDLTLQTKTLHHAQEQLARIRNLDRRAISQAELQEKAYEVSMGEVQVRQAQDNLELAKANLSNALVTLSQYTITAPDEGVVLQINSHVNEFVQSAQPIILLGDAHKVIVRVSLDERDTQRFNDQAAAYITSTENPSLKIPLIFLHLNRYIVTQERLNSRVQEILYYFDRKKFPNLIAGQQLEANILIRNSA